MGQSPKSIKVLVHWFDTSKSAIDRPSWIGVHAICLQCQFVLLDHTSRNSVALGNAFSQGHTEKRCASRQARNLVMLQGNLSLSTNPFANWQVQPLNFTSTSLQSFVRWVTLLLQQIRIHGSNGTTTDIAVASQRTSMTSLHMLVTQCPPSLN